MNDPKGVNYYDIHQNLGFLDRPLFQNFDAKKKSLHEMSHKSRTPPPFKCEICLL